MVRVVVGIVLVVGVLTGLVLFGISTTRPVVKPISYWVIDARTIGVVAFTGANRGCRLARVDETEAEVRVRVECDQVWISLGGTGALRINDDEVALDADLGARAVVDGDGRPATRCDLPRCE